MPKPIRYFSMFAGIGGFELGIQYAALSLGMRSECVGYSEIDKHAITTYEEHFDHTNYGDATTIDAAGLPDFDLLVGGFPCQSFSVAGKRRGFEDTRGTLFFDIARILEHKRPRNFILENVKGLLSHDSGRTLQTILGVLTDLGYCVEWQVLNSKDFGVPQNRERIYIVGHYGEPSGGTVFPFTGSRDGHLQEVTQGVSDAQRVYRPTLARTLKALGGGQGAVTGLYVDELASFPVVRNKRDGKVVYAERDIANCVDASYHKGMDYHGQRTGVATFMTREKRTGTHVYAEKDNSNAILTNQGKGVDWRSQRTMVGQFSTPPDTLRVRKLVPLETERLQGFPDNWTSGSDTQRYRQCGNAVTVNVVEAVVGRLYYSPPAAVPALVAA